MKASEIVGYALDRAILCVGCARGAQLQLARGACDCSPAQLDENGVCSRNCGGYGPNPVFAGDASDEHCDQCGEEL